MRTRHLIFVGLVGACGGPAKTTTTTTTPDQHVADDTVDPEIAALTAQLAEAKDPIEVATLHAHLGAVLWAASCPDDVFGLCIAKPEVHAAPRTTCASYQLDSVTSNVIAVARDATKAADAVSHFEAAIALDDHGKLLGPKPPDAEMMGTDHGASYLQKNALAMWLGDARLALVDRTFEASFVHLFPTDLDFAHDNAGSLKRFNAWFTETTDLLQQANTAYQALVSDETLFAWQPSLRFASAYRMGALGQWFADQLYSAPVPADLQADEDLYQAYCDTLYDKAEPLESHAMETFKACVVEAGEAGVTGPWPEQCRHEFNELDPTTVL